MKIEFQSDSYQVSGPKATDGSYKVTLTTGEYEAQNIAKLLTIPQRVVVKVTVEYEDV